MPNLSTLVGCKTDIVYLDVEVRRTGCMAYAHSTTLIPSLSPLQDVDLDWPPSL